MDKSGKSFPLNSNKLSNEIGTKIDFGNLSFPSPLAKISNEIEKAKGSGDVYIEDEFEINLCKDTETFIAQEGQIAKIADATASGKTVIFTLVIENSEDIPLGFNTISTYVGVEKWLEIDVAYFHGLDNDLIDKPVRVFYFIGTPQGIRRRLYDEINGGTNLPLPDDLYATVKIYNTNILSL